MKRLVFNPLVLLIASLFILASCNKTVEPPTANSRAAAEFNNAVPLAWNNLLLEVERFSPGFRPPVAARAFAYIGLATYETAVPGMPDFKTLENQFIGLDLPEYDPNSEYHFPTAVNAAYAFISSRMFPNAPSAQASKMISLEAQFNSQFQGEVSAEVYERSRTWGRSVAQAVYDWSSTDLKGRDGFLNNTPATYVPPAGPGKWQPTYPDFLPGLLPYWGEVRTFAASIDDKCPDHLPYSADPSSEFYVQALETENKVNHIKAGFIQEDAWIAAFWSDDCAALTFTPAARWIAVTNQLVEGENVTLEKALIAYAKVGMAINDAGVRAWGEKYRYNLLRPIDYIRLVKGNTNWNSIMCPDGTGQYFTPNFPAYPSGHATFAAAAAEVLTAEFGFDHGMTDRCHEGRSEFNGTPRTFGNFYEMAYENAYSRIPIGVHFRMDADAGLDLGYRIGRKVNNLPWK
jgi:hypothetical protein